MNPQIKSTIDNHFDRTLGESEDTLGVRIFDAIRDRSHEKVNEMLDLIANADLETLRYILEVDRRKHYLQAIEASVIKIRDLSMLLKINEIKHDSLRSLATIAIEHDWVDLLDHILNSGNPDSFVISAVTVIFKCNKRQLMEYLVHRAAGGKLGQLALCVATGLSLIDDPEFVIKTLQTVPTITQSYLAADTIRAKVLLNVDHSELVECVDITKPNSIVKMIISYPEFFKYTDLTQLSHNQAIDPDVLHTLIESVDIAKPSSIVKVILAYPEFFKSIDLTRLLHNHVIDPDVLYALVDLGIKIDFAVNTDTNDNIEWTCLYHKYDHLHYLLEHGMPITMAVYNEWYDNSEIKQIFDDHLHTLVRWMRESLKAGTTYPLVPGTFLPSQHLQQLLAPL